MESNGKGVRNTETDGKTVLHACLFYLHVLCVLFIRATLPEINEMMMMMTHTVNEDVRRSVSIDVAPTPLLSIVSPVRIWFVISLAAVIEKHELTGFCCTDPPAKQQPVEHRSLKFDQLPLFGRI